MTDPTEPIRLKASQYPNVIEGVSCNQTSFKIGKMAFLFIGEQGGRYKAMFKLDTSKTEAISLAAKHPDNYQAGSHIWVTARFTSENPIPTKRWEKWLNESYNMSLPKKK